MAHLRNASYYQDSHDEYASSSSSHRQPYHVHHLHVARTERRGRPAYTTVRPFVINSIDDHPRPIRSERDDHDEHHRRVGGYVADRLVPTMLRSSDRPVGVIMNFGDARLALPDTDTRLDDGYKRNRLLTRVPNAIIYNAPGCSLTLDGRRCESYCDRCDMVERDHRDRDWERHHRRHHDHRDERELDLELDRRHHDRPRRSRSHICVVSHSRNPSPSPLPLSNRDRHHHVDRVLDHGHNSTSRHRDRHPRPRSRSHVRITSHSRDPSPFPSPLPLPGLFPVATAVEKATHSNRSRSQHRGVSRVCPGCLIKNTLYRDGYCVDCIPQSYTSSSGRPDVFPLSSGTRVKYLRDTDGGNTSEDSWARVDVDSGPTGNHGNRRRGRARSDERVVYDVVTDSRGYNQSRRRGGSRWEKERSGRSMPRYEGYGSESDV